MSKPLPLVLFVTVVFLAAIGSRAQQSNPSPQASPPAQQQSSQQGQPALDEWADGFDGDALDQTKWERFTFEGGGGGSVEVHDGQLRMRGAGGSRSGVRTKKSFSGDRFIAEATVAKVGAALPAPGQEGAQMGNAILTVLFDSAGRNRIEWLITNEGRFEAWSIVDGRGERLDNHNLATRVENPVLSIARRGDDYYFALNGQVGLQKTIRGMPKSFRVMLYGYGSSENDWDSVRVVTPR